ncbi:MAG TPA: sigma-70 family RNA polymerase sigma factor [Thermodesulfobacteriota bacterium]|nr:sigma-70 family RNA polymerase sigma factor [Thermodesulfobacteriota bacterium]
MNERELDFQNIYDTFQPKIHRYLTRLVGEYEAEDLTQEVFVKISQRLKSFRGESQLSTWVYRIATNAALDKVRSPSFQQMVQKRSLSNSIAEGEIEIEDKVVWTGEKITSVDQQLIRKEMNDCIRNFIEKLPENHKTILVLSELEGLQAREIAEILQISLDTVKIRLHRAKAKLKKELETHCSFYRDERNELACDLKSAFEKSKKVD